MIRRVGEFVEFDGLLAVIIATPDSENSIPEGHLGLWFGSEQNIRKSEGGNGSEVPQIWVVPAEYCSDAPEWEQNH